MSATHQRDSFTVRQNKMSATHQRDSFTVRQNKMSATHQRDSFTVRQNKMSATHQRDSFTVRQNKMSAAHQRDSFTSEAKQNECHAPKKLIHSEAKQNECHAPKKHIYSEAKQNECHAPKKLIHSEAKQNECHAPKKHIYSEAKQNVCHAPKKHIYSEAKQNECHAPKKHIYSEAKQNECHTPKRLIHSDDPANDHNDDARIVSAPPSRNRPFDVHGERERLIQSDDPVDGQNDLEDARIVSATHDKGAQISAPSLPGNRPFDVLGERERLIQSDDPVDGQNDHDDARIMSATHDKGAQIRAPYLLGNRPFIVHGQHRRCWIRRRPDTHQPAQLTFLLSLVSEGTDINTQDPRGLTESAAECDKWAMAEFLINNGAVKSYLRKSHTLFHPHPSRPDLKSNNYLTLVVKLNTFIPPLPPIRPLPPPSIPPLPPPSIPPIPFKHSWPNQTYDVNLFLLHDVDINSRNDEGDAALHVFLRSVREPLKILTQHDADISLIDKHGISLFHKICAKQVVSSWYASTPLILDVLDFLVSKGLNINLPGKGGDSCLFIAVEDANWTIVERLVALGARCTMNVEERYKTLENLHLFPQKTSNPHRLHLFITHVLSQMPEERETIMLSNIPEEIKPRGEQRLLHSAAIDTMRKCISVGNFFVAEALIRCGSDLSLMFANYTLHSLVEHYTYERHNKWIRCLDALLSREDIDINFSYRDSSALAKAVKMLGGCINSTKDPLILALLERGADPLFTDENGHNLLRLIVCRCMDFNQDSTLNVLKCLVQLGVTTLQTRLTTGICTYKFGTVRGKVPRKPIMMGKISVAVVEILIESGAISNHELWDLHSSFKISLSMEAKKDARAKSILKIVKHAACLPRSLRSLCRLVISNAIGVGLERTKRVTSLPLPLSLQKYVLFEDVLSLNTKQQTHPIS